MTSYQYSNAGIDPRTDIVFQKLFGDQANERVLVAFLNDVLRYPASIERTVVNNSFVLSDYEQQKSLILDIQATDANGRVHRVELQRTADPSLQQRMLHDWARVYGAECKRGEGYRSLSPVVSIWLCDEPPFPFSKRAHLRFSIREVEDHFLLHGDFDFHVLQLSRWSSGQLPAGEARWFRFFNEASRWSLVPQELASDELEQAMNVLRLFRKDDRLRLMYEAELRAERVAADRRRAEREISELRDGLAKAVAEKDRERRRREALEARLRAAGIDFDNDDS